MTIRSSAVLLLLAFVAATGCARPQPPDVPANLRLASDIRQRIGGAAAATGATETAEVADPTGWATIRGRFRLTAPVSTGSFSINTDPAVCGRTAKDLSVITGPDNGLKNVLVYLSSKLPSYEDPWVHPDYAKTASEQVKFDQKLCVFLSQVTAMRTTQPLLVLNSDPVGHNTNIAEFSYNRIIPPGGSDSTASVKALTKPAAVSCSIHPWMQAFIMATPSPYFAVTDESGNFEIANVPAGVDLEFRVWQQRVEYVPGGVVNGANQNWPKGRIKLKLEPDQPLELDVVLDAARFQ